MTAEGLSPEVREALDQVRQQAEDLVVQISRLQRGWNHGAKATKAVDKAKEKLEEAGSTLADL